MRSKYCLSVFIIRKINPSKIGNGIDVIIIIPKREFVFIIVQLLMSDMAVMCEEKRFQVA
jgi:hypothetical protein